MGHRTLSGHLLTRPSQIPAASLDLRLAPQHPLVSQHQLHHSHRPRVSLDLHLAPQHPLVSQHQLLHRHQPPVSLDLRLAPQHPLVSLRQLLHRHQPRACLATSAVQREHPALVTLLYLPSSEEGLRDPTQDRGRQHRLCLETALEMLLLEVPLENQLVRQAVQAHCLVEQVNLHPLSAASALVRRRMRVEDRRLRRTTRTRQEEHLTQAYLVI